MVKSIYIYAEQFNGIVDETVGELVHAAKSMKADVPLTVFCFGKQNEGLEEQLSFEDVSLIILENEDTEVWQEDVRGHMVAEFLRQKSPSCVLIPATDTAKSVFARAAVQLKVGMTADCTEIFMQNGECLQKKPAFGKDAMVVTREKGDLAFITVIPGAYQSEKKGEKAEAEPFSMPEEKSRVSLIETEEYSSQSIQDAEILISLGRGADTEDAVTLARELARKLGGFVGGTRPLVDNGCIPFEAQIGQTGYTVHPKVCLFFGVSGAIQHTEGVRDTKLTIAVNTDRQAGIFSFADYGVLEDCKKVLQELVQLF